MEHLRLKFYRMFNCIYSKSKAANSEVVIIELMTEILLFASMFYTVEATLLSAANIRVFETCKQVIV